MLLTLSSAVGAAFPTVATALASFLGSLLGIVL